MLMWLCAAQIQTSQTQILTNPAIKHLLLLQCLIPPTLVNEFRWAQGFRTSLSYTLSYLRLDSFIIWCGCLNEPCAGGGNGMRISMVIFPGLVAFIDQALLLEPPLAAVSDPVRPLYVTWERNLRGGYPKESRAVLDEWGKDQRWCPQRLRLPSDWDARDASTEVTMLRGWYHHICRYTQFSIVYIEHCIKLVFKFFFYSIWFITGWLYLPKIHQKQMIIYDIMIQAKLRWMIGSDDRN